MPKTDPEPEPEFLRVRSKTTGHEFTIRSSRFDAEALTKVDRPALDVHGDPAPPKYRVNRPAKKTAPVRQEPQQEKATTAETQEES